jgi:4-amino-4-deoxy-L-arabinose transferase-like glycosyltransferase
MLFTTLALFAAHRLVQGQANARVLALFYSALVLSLWTKGFIGPVLVAFGLIGYAIARRSLKPLWSVRPGIALGIVGAASLVFIELVRRRSGDAAVYEWLWTNHVERFVNPTTGHAQPFYYYLYTIPAAVFPWVVPFLAALRPRAWAAPTDAERGLRDKKVFFAALCLGMTVILSASGTKRGIYLLPMLPPLLILLGAIASEQWAALEREARPWTSQLAVAALFAAAPGVAGLVYLREVNPVVAAFLAAVLLVWTLATALSRRNEVARWVALPALGVAGVVGWLGVAEHLAAPTKDLAPFVAWVGKQESASQPVYVVGTFDETVRGIVPFVTGRRIVHLSENEIDRIQPRFVLIHAKDGDLAPTPEPPYELLDQRRFGPSRYMALWQRGPSPGTGGTGQPHDPDPEHY